MLHVRQAAKCRQKGKKYCQPTHDCRRMRLQHQRDATRLRRRREICLNSLRFEAATQFTPATP